MDFGLLLFSRHLSHWCSHHSLVCIYIAAGAEACDSDVIFVIDESGSIGSSEYDQMIQFIKDVVTELGTLGNHDAIFGAVTFGSSANVDISLSLQLDTAGFLATIDSSNVVVKSGGGTPTDAGINAAILDFANK